MPMDYEDRDLIRATKAVMLGEQADRLFARECRRIGIDPLDAILAPSLWLSITHKVVRAD